MTNFLDSSILPGDNIPKHEHRKMVIILVIVLIVAIAVLVWFLSVAQTKVDIPVAPVVSGQQDPRAKALAELKKYEVPMTDQQKATAVKELSKYEVKLTDQQKADRVVELQKYIVK